MMLNGLFWASDTQNFVALDAHKLYLKADNKEYKDIRPVEALEIFGVVTGSFRDHGTR